MNCGRCERQNPIPVLLLGAAKLLGVTLVWEAVTAAVGGIWDAIDDASTDAPVLLLLDLQAAEAAIASARTELAGETSMAARLALSLATALERSLRVCQRDEYSHVWGGVQCTKPVAAADLRAAALVLRQHVALALGGPMPDATVAGVGYTPSPDGTTATVTATDDSSLWWLLLAAAAALVVWR